MPTSSRWSVCSAVRLFSFLFFFLFFFLVGPRPTMAQCTSDCGNFYTVPPCRLIDTRFPGPGPYSGQLVSDIGRSYDFRGVCGISSTATAVAINVTVVAPTDAGYLKIFPKEAPPPPTSAINFSAGQTRANNGLFRLSSNGFLSVYPSLLNQGSTHLVVDVFGYFD